jgi:hypothetical protein
MNVNLIVCFKNHTWAEHTVKIKFAEYENESAICEAAKKEFLKDERYRNFYCVMINSYSFL